jgi:hypothetical protein
VCAWFLYDRAIALFTAPQPADADFMAAERRLKGLRQATAGNEEITIEFSAADLNALIVRDPGFTPCNRNFNESFRGNLEKNQQQATFWNRIKTISLDGDRLVITAQRT